MHASEVTPEVVEKANELYWSSDRSVNQIADDLELSKGTLYDIIEPDPSGLGCPLCGDEVVYSNRTARDREMLDCPTCEWEGSTEEATEHEETAFRAPSERTDGEIPDVEDSVATGSTRPPRQVPPPASRRVPANTIAGGALLGAAVGLALVLWARRR